MSRRLPPVAIGLVLAAVLALGLVQASAARLGTVSPDRLTVLRPSDLPSPPDAAPVTVALNPDHDAHIWAGAASTNHGAAALLQVNPHMSGPRPNDNHRISYVRFDLSGIPAGAQITDASLRLTANASTTRDFAATVVAPTAGACWQEGTVTWDSQPSATSQTASTTAAGTSVEWEGGGIVEHAQMFLDAPASNCGWQITDTTATGNNLTEFHSREAATSSWRPQLVVTYTP